MRSSEYLGNSVDGGVDDFAKPIHLRIYGHNILDRENLKLNNWKRDKTDLLFLSELIQSEEWKVEVATILPTKTVNFLLFEAFWHTPTLVPYNGHLLLDNISHLVKD